MASSLLYQLAFIVAPGPDVYTNGIFSIIGEAGWQASANYFASIYTSGVALFESKDPVIPSYYFAYAGPHEIEPERESSINVQIVENGYAYFDFKRGFGEDLSTELRTALATAEVNAFNSGLGIWQYDYWKLFRERQL